MKAPAARLLLFNGAPAYRRMAGIVFGVALGVGMLLILLGAYLHIPDRDARSAWLQPDGVRQEFTDNGDLVPVAPSDDQIVTSRQVDVYDGTLIEVLFVGSTPSTTVEFPAGLERPGSGEFYASAALDEILADVPEDLLADRWGTQLGVLPDDAVTGPTQHAILAGTEWERVSGWSDAFYQESFREVGPVAVSLTYRVIVAMGAIALLVPILLLISIVSALGAVERRERFATVRLIGAGRRSVAALAGAEMAVATAVGAILGVGVAALLRPFASNLVLSGSTFFEYDLAPSLAWTAAVLIAITALGGGTAWWRAYRDDIGALGATREREEKPVTAWRTTTLVLGILMFAGSALAATTASSGAAFLGVTLVLGFALIAFGIVIAGPWITRVASTALGATTSSAAGLVAAGRLRRHPRATFRSVAGLVVAVFVVSVFAGGSSAIAMTQQARDLPGRLDPTTLIAYPSDQVDAEQAAERLRGVDGVEGVVIAWRPANDDLRGSLMSADDARLIGAADVPNVPTVSVDVFAMMMDNGPGSIAQIEAPQEAPVSLDGLQASEMLVLTRGDMESIERARTAIAAEVDSSLAATTRADQALRGGMDTNEELATLAYLGMAIAIAVSALALTVATAAAIIDRRRTFGLLRLGGMPVRQLRLTTVVEAVVPLAVTLLASAGLGYGVAAVVIESLGDDMSVAWPDTRYWWAIGASLAVATVALVSTFGSVRRSTELESTRFE